MLELILAAIFLLFVLSMAMNWPVDLKRKGPYTRRPGPGRFLPAKPTANIFPSSYERAYLKKRREADEDSAADIASRNGRPPPKRSKDREGRD